MADASWPFRTWNGRASWEFVDGVRLHAIGGEQVLLCRVEYAPGKQVSWHKHDDTDDFFLVLKGRLVIELRDRNVALGPGELFVVPKGVEHRPVANEEVHMLLIERSGTPNTGDAATAAPRRFV